MLTGVKLLSSSFRLEESVTSQVRSLACVCRNGKHAIGNNANNKIADLVRNEKLVI
ncbi:hypothetical protein [Roseibium sediminis]|uniref:hypothetical protein n=1 Tax=Roseibium sediminis TaxID=1775174 RepID=UPI0013756791|nr:hypothetical protein [Roseibium sediminis]